MKEYSPLSHSLQHCQSSFQLIHIVVLLLHTNSILLARNHAVPDLRSLHVYADFSADLIVDIISFLALLDTDVHDIIHHILLHFEFHLLFLVVFHIVGDITSTDNIIGSLHHLGSIAD